MPRLRRRAVVAASVALLVVGIVSAVALTLGGAQMSDIVMALLLPLCAVVAGTWFDALRGSAGRDSTSRSEQ